MLEKWNNGLAQIDQIRLKSVLFNPIIPVLHYSITPLLPYSNLSTPFILYFGPVPESFQVRF